MAFARSRLDFSSAAMVFARALQVIFDSMRMRSGSLELRMSITTSRWQVRHDFFVFWIRALLLGTSPGSLTTARKLTLELVAIQKRLIPSPHFKTSNPTLLI